LSSFSSLFAEFVGQANPARAQIINLPSIIFVFGRHIREKPNDAPSGMRDMFVSWAREESHEISSSLKLPENYPAWNQFNGYDDLTAFECDAACISRAILLFVESEGAFAELGAFCMQEVLVERLYVVLYTKHYKSTSYIALGPLRVLKRVQGDEPSICPVDGDTLVDFQKVLPELADLVLEKSKQSLKTHKFNPGLIRDQFLFIADMVELFGALNVKEITELLFAFGMNLGKPRVDQMLNLLCSLKVILLAEHLTRQYYVPPKDTREGFIGYRSLISDARLGRVQFKFRALEVLKKDSFRRQAYEKIHGRQ
jgi:hypothetical protein